MLPPAHLSNTFIFIRMVLCLSLKWLQWMSHICQTLMLSRLPQDYCKIFFVLVMPNIAVQLYLLVPSVWRIAQGREYHKGTYTKMKAVCLFDIKAAQLWSLVNIVIMSGPHDQNVILVFYLMIMKSILYQIEMFCK